ncbi:hypothetical protein [Roseinatronobacter monicus]|uniref:hypothetical protein n=1 Tax=Roseinatronobacter monicus TaxID=393481 RepID=UPI0011547604|nr:hypothetical protein [Roseinatronobacter monicus]
MGFGPTDQDVVFIFRDHDLIDCSDPARALLKSLTAPDKAKNAHSDYAVLLQYLAQRFPDVQTRLAGLAQSGPWEISSHTGDGLVLGAQFHKGLPYWGGCYQEIFSQKVSPPAELLASILGRVLSRDIFTKSLAPG